MVIPESKDGKVLTWQAGVEEAIDKLQKSFQDLGRTFMPSMVKVTALQREVERLQKVVGESDPAIMTWDSWSDSPHGKLTDASDVEVPGRVIWANLRTGDVVTQDFLGDDNRIVKECRRYAPPLRFEELKRYGEQSEELVAEIEEEGDDE